MVAFGAEAMRRLMRYLRVYSLSGLVMLILGAVVGPIYVACMICHPKSAPFLDEHVRRSSLAVQKRLTM
jgi:hypothetical protein